MKLDIVRGIQNKGIEVPFDLTDIWGEDTWNGDVIRYVRPVRFTGTFMIADETVVIRGTAETVIEGPCARCLEPAVVSVSAPVAEAYVRDKGEEIDPFEEDQYRYKGHVLDLDDAVRTALLLELPTRFLCQEECKGLCPVCGTNLNHKSCDCQKELPRRSPFSALAELLNEDEEV